MAWNGLIISLFLIFLAMGFLLVLRSRQLNQETGLPAGKVIYTDSGVWQANEESFHSADLRLIGKPDYLVREKTGEIIPVELKSGKAPISPREGHVLQLMAYCLLVEENFDIRPSHGILQYKDRAFAVNYTAELEEDLLAMLEEIRACYHHDELQRNHRDYQRCAACGYRDNCQQSLTR